MSTWAWAGTLPPHRVLITAPLTAHATNGTYTVRSGKWEAQTPPLRSDHNVEDEVRSIVSSLHTNTPRGTVRVEEESVVVGAKWGLEFDLDLVLDVAKTRTTRREGMGDFLEAALERLRQARGEIEAVCKEREGVEMEIGDLRVAKELIDKAMSGDVKRKRMELAVGVINEYKRLAKG